MYDAQKAKGYHHVKISKFQALISKRDVLSKKDQMSWIIQKPNEKLLNFVIILL